MAGLAKEETLLAIALVELKDTISRSMLKDGLAKIVRDGTYAKDVSKQDW